MTGTDVSVVFTDELPVPTTNIAIYEQVYVLEQWLRRIAYASLMAKHGPRWRGTLPGQLSQELKRRLNQLRGRVHLHAENSDNAIWLLTLDELRELLVAPGIWPVVKDLTGLPQHVVEEKLDELREIRNIVGHNRATTRQTAVFVEAIALALRPGIDAFKKQLIYGAHDTIHSDDLDEDSDAVQMMYARHVDGNDWAKFQPMLSSSRYFYSLTRLPVEPFDSYLRLKAFLGEVGDADRVLLAALVNKTGGEFSICWPRNATIGDHEQSVRFFFGTHRYVWTQTEYARQTASAVCDPRIWFYENQAPAEE